MEYNLERFIKAQKNSYETALSEIRNERKRSHWMWYIFPQIIDLGSKEERTKKSSNIYSRRLYQRNLQLYEE
ncbi:MAG: DUF1810 domain-containing protein [Clostridiales bacterium]|nr:DUF1810 domain-containing protein [Clostridiales bacterium]